MFDRDLAIELIDALSAAGINSNARVLTFPGEPGMDDGGTPGWSVTPTGQAHGQNLDIVRLAEITKRLGIGVRYSPASGFSLSPLPTEGAE